MKAFSMVLFLASMRFWMLLMVVYSLRCDASSESPPMCTLQSDPLIIDSFRSQCPLSFISNSPREVNGELYERAITYQKGNAYTSVLFYASWCPFSATARSKFEVLSSMFPQIQHLAVEHSSAMPSLFSRYGIHSLPTIFIVNQTSRLRYHGPKDLDSFTSFYTRTTGYEPVSYIMYQEKEPSNDLESQRRFILQSWIGLSGKEILKRETYVVFALMFLCLKLVEYVFPVILHRLKEIWVSYGPQLNLQIFGESSQIMGRVVHMMDVKSFWRLCKSRNIYQRARNARVWASSLTSVSSR